MYERAEKLAAAEGFERVYFLAPARLTEWKEQAEKSGFGLRLPWDLPAAFPKAESIMLLVFPYRPYPPEERVPAYYINSNLAYHAAKRLVASLIEAGIAAERVELPARALALFHGLGVQGRNGLLRISPFGSRIVLETLCCDLPGKEYEMAEEPPCPKDCAACRAACPAGAIGSGGLNAKSCLRAAMGSAQHPELVKQKQRWFIGCEACLFACPFNAGSISPLPGEIAEAFELSRLVGGDAAAARQLCGHNMTGGGRLSAEAIVFAARQGLFEREIRETLLSPLPAVQQAASWALDNFFNKS